MMHTAGRRRRRGNIGGNAQGSELSFPFGLRASLQISHFSVQQKQGGRRPTTALTSAVRSAQMPTG